MIDEPAARTDGLGEAAAFAACVADLGALAGEVRLFFETRPDLVPEAWLAGLPPAHAAPSQPLLTMDELRADIGLAFQAIEPLPTGSSAISLVYSATLDDGDAVAVKLLRPGIAAQVEPMVKRLESLERLFERAGVAQSTRGGLPNLLRDWLMARLDLPAQLRNLEMLRHVGGDDSGFVLPAPYAGLSTARVLTVERLDGVPLAVLDAKPIAERERTLARLDLDGAMLARDLLHAMLDQMLGSEIFSVDLNSRGLVLLSDNQVGLVDFCAVERVNRVYQPSLRRFLRALVDDDPEMLWHALAEMVVETDTFDRAQLRTAFLQDYRLWRRLRDGGAPDARRSAESRFLVAMLWTVRTHGFELPADLLALFRSLISATRLAWLLSDQVDLVQAGRGYFERRDRFWLLDALTGNRLRIEASRWADILRDAPGNLNNLLADIVDERFVLRIEQSESASTRERANHRALVVSLAILALADCVLLSGLLRGNGAVALLGGVGLGVVLFALLGWMVIVWRRLS